jgi:hypothetical protein
MSHLDEKAKPLFTPLILGQDAELDQHSQCIVATWLIMKFMVSEFFPTARRINARGRAFFIYWKIRSRLLRGRYGLVSIRPRLENNLLSALFLLDDP